MKIRLALIAPALVLLAISACGGEDTDIQATIDAAVSATATAQPTPTPDIQATINAAVSATATAQAPAPTATSVRPVRYDEAALRQLLTAEDIESTLPWLDLVQDDFGGYALFSDLTALTSDPTFEQLVSFTGLTFQTFDDNQFIFQVRDFKSPSEARLAIENSGNTTRYEPVNPGVGERSYISEDTVAQGFLFLSDGAIFAIAGVGLDLNDADIDDLIELARLVESRLGG